ncbi:hypothetical protein OG871_14950 [Kitasatospora sp. NBC_00374]|uniref:hypothetical protein n=1 Tax=Kitasatospora sp. NBC_00374 TaxID=2975964 RepID=UPI0030E1BEEF
MADQAFGEVADARPGEEGCEHGPSSRRIRPTAIGGAVGAALTATLAPSPRPEFGPGHQVLKRVRPEAVHRAPRSHPHARSGD